MSAVEGHTSIGGRPEYLRRPPRETQLRSAHRGSAQWQTSAFARRNVSTLLALLVLSVCAAAVLLHAPARPVPSIHRHAPLASRGLLSLPGALRGPASQTLGAQDPAYHAVTVPGGLRIVNPAQRLSARFEASGVRVHAGKLGLGLTLARAGYGSRLATVGAATPAARANRITYDRGWIEEWYTNGPVGLEQGFTIPRGPGGAARGPLQLALSLSGGARATGLPGGEGIRFSARHASLVYGAPSAKDALGHPLRSWLQLQAGQVLLHVDTRRAVYPVRIDPFIQQGSKMTAGEIGAGQFGVSVALSADGNTALVGASNDNGGIGAVWVFVRSGGAWAEQGEKLTGAEETGKGEFGSSVALAAEGNTAVIAGWKDNGDRGAAWVFTRSNGVWSQQGSKITPTGESGAGKFGVSVAVSSEGDTALIGGHVDNNFLGAVWVFTRSGGVWSQQGEKLTGSGEVGKGGFGQSVALSSDGNTALVGAYHDNNFLGAAWVFTRSAGVWSQQGEKLTGGGEEEGQAWLGNAVALSSDGNTALIGGYHDNGELGAAWVFTRSAGVWSQQGKKLTGGEESAGGTFATSVALSADGNTALMGGYKDSVEKGAAWVFLRSAGVWSQQGKKLTGGEEAGGGTFGNSVALSADGNTALMGGEADATNAGAAWVFTRVSGEWGQQGEKLTGTVEREAGQFGIGTVISADGKTALVGARLDNKEHGAAWVFVRSGTGWVRQAKLTGGAEEVGAAGFGKGLALSANGNTAMISGELDEGIEGKQHFQQGAVWVFTRSGAKWKQQGKKLLAPEAGHCFGRDVALSADGNTALIGTFENEPQHAYVFARTGETWGLQSVILRPEHENITAFGETVRLSDDGQTALVATGQDDEETGSVVVFAKQNGVWRQQGPKLTGAGQKGEHFAGALALSGDGNTILVGSSGPFPLHTGRAYVFTRTGESWAPQGAPLVGTGVVPFVSSFSVGVALSDDGNTALMGGEAEAGTGALWEFKRTESTWAQVGEKMVASGTEGEAGFGAPIALSSDGSTALVAGPQDASHTGAVWVFMESPSLASASATEVTSSSAKLDATVNPQGEQVTECQFEYGTSSAYGSTASCSPSPGSGSSPVSVSSSIAGLTANTVYHFRLSSSNGHGVQRTVDQTFTTLETSATAETKEASVPAKAKDGGLSVEGKGGTGQVTIGPYGNNIGGSGLIGGKGAYFQVYRGGTSSFTTVQYTDCELGGAKSLWWFNSETGWEPIPASMSVYTEGSPACITVTATEATQPSIAQLSDPRHVGGPEAGGQAGKCEAAKHAAYTAGDCKTASIAKGKGKGAFAWYGGAPPQCFPLKKGWYKEAKESAAGGLECNLASRDPKKKGNFETGGGSYTSKGVSATTITVEHEDKSKETIVTCPESASTVQEVSAHQSIETITYKGCEHAGQKCTGAINPGEIVTTPLESFITRSGQPAVYLEALAGKEEGANVTGSLEPRRGLVMRFSCGGEAYVVRGAVAGQLSSFAPNSMMTSSEVHFGASSTEELQLEEVQKGKSLPATLVAAAKNEYGNEPQEGLEFGEIGEVQKEQVVELLQKAPTDKKYTDYVPTIKAGEEIKYEVIVRNIFPLERSFAALRANGCEGITPAGGFTIEANGKKEFFCTHKFAAPGQYATTVDVSGSTGFGTVQSKEEKVNVQ